MACPVVFVVNNPCSCYIVTCSKKLQSEIIIQIKHDVAPRHIQNLETSVVRAGEGCSRRRNGQEPLVETAQLSFSASQRKLTTNEEVSDVKTSPRGELYLLNLSSVWLKFVFRRVQLKKLSYLLSNGLVLNQFVLRGEIASRNEANSPNSAKFIYSL